MSSHSVDRFKTPHAAIYLLAPVVGVVPFVLVADGISPLNIFAYLGTLATYGYLLAYVLVSVAAPIYLSRRHVLTPLPVIVAVLATVAIGYVIYKNLRGRFMK